MTSFRLELMDHLATCQDRLTLAIQGVASNKSQDEIDRRIFNFLGACDGLEEGWHAERIDPDEGSAEDLSVLDD